MLQHNLRVHTLQSQQLKCWALILSDDLQIYLWNLAGVWPVASVVCPELPHLFPLGHEPVTVYGKNCLSFITCLLGHHLSLSVFNGPFVSFILCFFMNVDYAMFYGFYLLFITNSIINVIAYVHLILFLLLNYHGQTILRVSVTGVQLQPCNSDMTKMTLSYL